MEGTFLVFNVHSPKISHGEISWNLKNQGTGDALDSGTAAELSIPSIVGPLESDALCLELTSNSPGLRPYWLYVTSEPF